LNDPAMLPALARPDERGAGAVVVIAMRRIGFANAIDPAEDHCMHSRQ